MELKCGEQETRILSFDYQCFNLESGKYELEFPALERDSGEIKEQKWYISRVTATTKVREEMLLKETDLKEESEDGQITYKYWYTVTNEESVMDARAQEKQSEITDQVYNDTNSQEKAVNRYKVFLRYYSTGADGKMQRETVIQYTDAGSKVGDIIPQAKEKGEPISTHPGMKFEGWVYGDFAGQTEDTLITDYSEINLYAEYDKVLVNCLYLYTNVDGDEQEEEVLEIVDKKLTKREVLEKLCHYKIPESICPDLPFDSWKWPEMMDEYLNQPVEERRGAFEPVLEPDYKNGLIDVEYTMLDEHRKTKTVNKKIKADLDITNEEALELCLDSAPGAEYKELTRKNWYNKTEYLFDGGNTKKFFEQGNPVKAAFSEEYTDHVWVGFNYESVMSNGESKWISEDKLYPYGTKTSQAIEDGKKTTLKPEFKGLKFKGWEQAPRQGMPETIDDTWFGDISYEPVADNCLVQYHILSAWGKGSNFLHAYTVEKNTRIILPSSFMEHQNIVWDVVNDMETTVQKAITTYYGEQNVVDNTVANPDISKPYMTVYLPENEVNGLIQQINSSKEGERIECQMDNATILPQQVLEAMAGKAISVEFIMNNGVTWQIDGKNVPKEGVKDTNMLAQLYNRGNGPIPQNDIDAIADGRSTSQLDLAHEGAFEFDAKFIIGVDAELNGKKAVLLWYSNGIMDWTGSAMVVDSKLSLGMNHASQYALIYTLNGDVDNNGEITIRDLMRVMHHISGSTLMEALQQGIADIDFNNKVNIRDLMKLLHHLSGQNPL